jgi:hypothetical protein
MGNSGDRSNVQWLKEWMESTDEGLRSAARWALSKLTD